MNTHVVYHHPCNDGFCAAWVWNRFCTEGCNFIQGDYQNKELVNDLLKLDEQSNLAILDFSFSPEDMGKLCDHFTHIVLIDHHEKAVQALQDFNRSNLYKVLDMSHSGAYLTWVYLVNSANTPPWQVLYTEDRDLWKHQLHGTEEINTYLTIIPQTFEAWSNATEFEAYSNGKGALAYKNFLVKQHVETARFGKLGDINVATVACTSKVLASDIGNELVKLGYVGIVSNNGCSVRSNGEVNVNLLCQKYGGGGHPKAAGCSLDLLKDIIYVDETR